MSFIYFLVYYYPKAPYLCIVPPHVQPVVGQNLWMLVDMSQCQLNTGHNTASSVGVLHAVAIGKETRYVNIGPFGSSRDDTAQAQREAHEQR